MQTMTRKHTVAVPLDDLVRGHFIALYRCTTSNESLGWWMPLEVHLDDDGKWYNQNLAG